MKKLNIIYVHTHDTGRFLSPYGVATPTSNILEFAKEATVFRNCFSAAPTCSPSRAALLTGYTPHQNGMLGLVNRGWHLTDEKRHLASFLAQNGYETVLCGIQHESQDWKTLGYTKKVGLEESYPGSRVDWDIANTDSALRFLEDRTSDKPFFLSMGWFNTHRDYPKAQSETDSNYVQVPFCIPDCQETREDMADFYTSVKVVDECFSKLYAAIDRLGLKDNTIIIFTTDHGIAFPMMKCNLYDTGIGVNLMIRYPGNPSSGKVVDSLVSHYDVYPTLCEMLGLDKPSWLCGRSFLPILEGRTQEIRDEVFAEVTYHAAYEPKRCIRTKRYKYIKLYYEANQVPSNIDEGKSKTYLIKNGYLEEKKDREFLFDLILDPMERVNLVNVEKYQDIRKDLSARLEKWMQDTSDPLLHTNFVPKPVGAKVNKQDCLNPATEDYEEESETDYQY